MRAAADACVGKGVLEEGRLGLAVGISCIVEIDQSVILIFDSAKGARSMPRELAYRDRQSMEGSRCICQND